MKMLYDPGPKKREDIMIEQAIAVVFGVQNNSAARKKLIDHLFLSLETLQEVAYAFPQSANRNRADLAVQEAIGRQRGKAREVILRLESEGLVSFTQTANGKCVDMPESTQVALKQLFALRRRIQMVLLAEEGYLEDFDVSEHVKTLEDLGIYEPRSADELHTAMRNYIDPEAGEYLPAAE